MIRSASLALVVAISLSGCTTMLRDPDFMQVTIAELRADPEAWDGRKVEVRGYAVSEFENYNLYPNIEAFCRQLTDNRVGLSVGVEWWDANRSGINRRIVIVRRTFENLLSARPPLTVSSAHSFGPITEPFVAEVYPQQMGECG